MGATLDDTVQSIINERLKPFVKQIDAEAIYPSDYIQAIAQHGYFQSQQTEVQNLRFNDLQIIEATAETCMTTAFNIWCHLAAATYLRLSGRPFLQQQLLPQIELGKLCGGTGLSNPMKFYAGLERLCLKAERVQDGYVISGQLPAVSNLGGNHAFACIAALDEKRRIMVLVPHDSEGLHQTEKTNFIGLNGSATYTCKLDHVFVADDWVIADDADAFVEKIRATFVLYQIPLGLGVTSAAIEAMRHASHVQGGCNQFLDIQPDRLEREWAWLRKRTYELAADHDLDQKWHDVLRLRLDVVKLTMDAVHASMIHCGGSAYLQASAPARRLREAYFLVNLTPTMKHLQKLTQRS